MIFVKKIKDGFRCDMCFAKPDYEICGDDRYSELLAFTLHLCTGHAEQLAKAISFALDTDKNMKDIDEAFKILKKE